MIKLIEISPELTVLDVARALKKVGLRLQGRDGCLVMVKDQKQPMATKIGTLVSAHTDFFPRTIRDANQLEFISRILASSERSA